MRGEERERWLEMDDSDVLAYLRGGLDTAVRWKLIDIPDGVQITILNLDVDENQISDETVIVAAPATSDHDVVFTGRVRVANSNIVPLVDQLIGLINKALE